MSSAEILDRAGPPAPEPPPRGLWHHRDFRRLWAGQTVSLLGSRVTELALPVTAIVLLDASPAQLGLLNSAQYLPVLCVTLFAGVLADRVRRRPLLITANLGRAAILTAVPLLAWLGGLGIWALCAVAFATGVLTALFDVAYQAYVPSLVAKEQLVEGNSKLQASRSVAETAGQGLGGTLIQVLTAPVAILVDCLGYLFGAAMLLRIRTPETRPVRADGARSSVRKDIAAGLRMTLNSRLLRVIMLHASLYNLLWDVVLVVFPLYAIRVLHLGPAGLGLVIAAGSIGAFGGALSAGRLGKRLGVGRAMVSGMAIASSATLLLPLAAGAGTGPGYALLATGYVLNGFGIAIFNIHSITLRQATVPPELIGRVSATFRFLTWAVIPVGGLLGGLLASAAGPRTALALTAGGLTAAAVAFLCSRTAVRS
ncbi:MFS transporter [Streptomyces poriferorum]|uniref:MFS transporter n=1 Tax=Streptomyces poriferorum TaxID=2798799 RepID=A0ABY9IS26_9ACTN|nr:MULTISPECIES: MFS transporter [Streptomyces]MBW5248166.1 MFS transporter [Streptomyces poriferorum]MBW5255786.1 MFS transporter [Streptomyces poriferorum]MDP5312775.1 MFS transporter [Streptomyces sp. Alt4]WLQ49119.1 MFS transporter [Streptomyces sp. Alt1]WLQ58208.1 MFS transporter [Streptomyces sp. Alt2]